MNSNLQIGYCMQNGAPDLSTLSGPMLHTVAVISGLQKAGHHVRTIATQRKRLDWSDDLSTWRPAPYGLTATPWFRGVESPVRRLQSQCRAPFVGLFDSLRFADACTQLLRGYDLIYERHGYMGYGGVLAARRLGIPAIIELNGNIVKEIDEMGVQMSPVQRRIGRWLTFRTFLTASHVVVVSEALKNILITTVGLPAAKVSVVLNGVDVDLFTRPFVAAHVREQFHIAHRPTVAFVGSFQPWHGVELLVASFQLVQTQLPEAQLLLVGDGPGRQAVEGQLAALGLQPHVQLLGRLDQKQVAAVLSVADVVVAPYPLQHDEIVGTPLKLMEYMAAGKAIVASTAPIHELIIEGVTGIRVKPANAGALAEGITQLLRNPELRTRLATQAKRQGQQYGWAHVVEKLCDIFQAELDKRSAQAPVQAATALPAQNFVSKHHQQ